MREEEREFYAAERRGRIREALAALGAIAVIVGVMALLAWWVGR